MDDLIRINDSFLPTKANIQAISERIALIVDEGNADPLKIVVQLTAAEKVCKEARELLQQQTLLELSKYGKTATILGAKIEAREVGVKWDYSNSPAWLTLNAQKQEIDKKLKAVEQIAKTLPEGHQSSFVDESTGETLDVLRGIKTSESSYAITLEK